MWQSNREDSGPCPQRREALVGGQRQGGAVRGAAAGAEGQGGWWRRRFADGYTAADLSSCWKWAHGESGAGHSGCVLAPWEAERLVVQEREGSPERRWVSGRGTPFTQRQLHQTTLAWAGMSQRGRQAVLPEGRPLIKHHVLSLWLKYPCYSPAAFEAIFLLSDLLFLCSFPSEVWWPSPHDITPFL